MKMTKTGGNFFGIKKRKIMDVYEIYLKLIVFLRLKNVS